MLTYLLAAADLPLRLLMTVALTATGPMLLALHREAKRHDHHTDRQTGVSPWPDR